MISGIEKIVRIITFSDFLAHTRPIFLKLNLLPLCKVVLQRASIFMYKLINNDIHQYNTRQKHQLHGTRPTCKSVVHSFSTRSSQIWNAMSNVIDSHNSLLFILNIRLRHFY